MEALLRRYLGQKTETSPTHSHILLELDEDATALTGNGHAGATNLEENWVCGSAQKSGEQGCENKKTRCWVRTGNFEMAVSRTGRWGC